MLLHVRTCGSTSLRKEALKAVPVREQINPIKCQQANHHDPHRVFFRNGPIYYSHPRPPACNDGKGVEIESDQPAEGDERERIPSQRREKISMQECDRRASGATSHAGQTGDREEWTFRPGQREGQPSRPTRKRCHRNGEPDQFVVRFFGRSTTPQKTHRSLL